MSKLTGLVPLQQIASKNWPLLAFLPNLREWYTLAIRLWLCMVGEIVLSENK